MFLLVYFNIFLVISLSLVCKTSFALFQLNINGLIGKKLRLTNLNGLSSLTYQQTQSIQICELSSNKLVKLDGIKSLSNLLTLNANNNNLRNIDELENILNLTNLDLSNNQITNLDALKNLINLELLNLNANQIQSLNFNLINLLKLKYLNLNTNKLISISSNQLPIEIEKLDLGENFLEEFIIDHDMFNHLKEVNLIKNKIIYFRLNNTKISRIIEKINLVGNKLSKFEIIGYYSSLTLVNLSKNNLILIDEITNINNLINFYSESNNIFSIDNNVCKINELNDINLKNNHLNSIDCLLLGLKYLKKINVENNLIQGKIKIGNLNGLVELNLCQNKIASLEFDYVLNQLITLKLTKNFLNNLNGITKKLPNLQILYADFNDLNEIEWIENLTQIHWLILANNKIRDISYLRNLIGLNVLDLNNNQINDIKWIRNLTDLGKLYLSNNEINFIEPDLFDNFKYLWLVDLSHNKIKFLNSFGKSLILTHVDLSFNELSNVIFLNEYKSITNLTINNNQIENIDILILLNGNNVIVKLNMAMNPINNFGTGKLMDLNKNLRFIFTDELILNSLYSILINNRIQKKTDSVSFLLALYLVIPNNLFYGDCQLKINYLKRNIHFNLYYQFQIDHFLSNCNL